MSVIWYSDADLIILSDVDPVTGVVKPLPSDTPAERKAKRQKPYINKRRVIFIVKYLGEEFVIPIKKGYRWDGATCLGLHHLPFLLNASMVHDFCCENHSILHNDRELSTRLFKEIGIASGGWRWFMTGAYHVINVFQKYFGRDRQGYRWTK